MAQNKISTGEILDHVAGGTINSGELVTVGDMVGIASNTVTSGKTVSVFLEGVFEVPKATGAGTALAAGVTVYRDGSNQRVTATSTGNKAVGRVWKAAGTADTTVLVKLCNLPAGA